MRASSWLSIASAVFLVSCHLNQEPALLAAWELNDPDIRSSYQGQRVKVNGIMGEENGVLSLQPVDWNGDVMASESPVPLHANFDADIESCVRESMIGEWVSVSIRNFASVDGGVVEYVSSPILEDGVPSGHWVCE